MARLIALRAKNFCAFEDLHLPLANQGLVFISGVNLDTDSATSNGACKTGMYKALGWVAYAKSIDDNYGDKVIRHGTKCAMVELEIEDDDDKYLVRRERRKQSPKLFLEKNGEAIKGSKADLQRIIEGLMGVDWEGFKNTVMYGQGDRNRFVYPTTKDGDRKRILHRILRTGVFELAHAEAKKRRLQMQRIREQLESAIDELGRRISDHDIEAIEERLCGFDDENKTLIMTLAADARALVKRAKEAKGGDLEAVEKAISDLEAKVVSVREERIDQRGLFKGARDRARLAALDHAELRRESKAVASSLEDLEGDKCPTCTGTLSKGQGKAHKASLRASLDDLVVRTKAADREHYEATQAESDIDERLDDLDSELEEVESALRSKRLEAGQVKSNREKAAGLAERAREKAAEARAAKKRKNPHAQPLEEARKKVSELKRSRKAKKKELRKTDVQMAALEFWVRGYGPTGIPSFALDSVMPILTERANHYLETLSDGDMSINFSTQRELKSGDEFRDEIGVTWSIEGIEEYPPSGGQWKKMEIATNFAMMDLVGQREGGHLNLLCLDECLDGLDGEGRQRVVQLLHELRSERESIFVISHDTGFSEIFEKTIVVTKQDGVSTAKMAA